MYSFLLLDVKGGCCGALVLFWQMKEQEWQNGAIFRAPEDCGVFFILDISYSTYGADESPEEWQFLWGLLTVVGQSEYLITCEFNEDG